jgi:hypothetical protein
LHQTPIFSVHIDREPLLTGLNDWSQLITGEKTFASLHPSLKAFDQAIGR